MISIANVTKRYRSSGHAGTGPGGYTDWLSRLSAAGSPSADGNRPEVQQPPAASKVTSTRSPTPQSPKPATLFPTDSKSVAKSDTDLINGYKTCNRTLDDLPYTDEFESLFAAASKSHPEMDKYQVFRRLHNLRKAGKLPKSGAAATLPVKLQPKEESWLSDRVVEIVGSLGQRDQLPYHAKFDGLVEQFNAETGRTLSPHDVWRVVAKLAK